MVTLGIDTATSVGGVSLFKKDEGTIGEVRLKAGRRLSEAIVSCIDFILNASGFKLEDIDFFTISIGPGAFTGLRVGLSTVKGLSFATGKPVVTVSTLQAYASSFPLSGLPICPVLDARKGEIYTGVFKWEGGRLSTMLTESVMDVGRLLGLLRGDTLFAGSGAWLYRERIVEHLGLKAHFAPGYLNSPVMSALCEMGIMKAEEGDFSDPAKITPLYLRRSEAETAAGPVRQGYDSPPKP